MNLSEAVNIFEPFHEWCKNDKSNVDFTEYTPEQVLEAQGVILNEAKENLKFETSVKDPLN